MDQHGVDCPAAIIDRGVPDHFDDSGLGIHLHFARGAGVAKDGRLMI
jgi:hypothetical protein